MMSYTQCSIRVGCDGQVESIDIPRLDYSKMTR